MKIERTIKPGQEPRGSRRLRMHTTGPMGESSPPVGPHDVDPSEMAAPYQCHGCRLVFDGGHVEVTARYVDCSMWKCPHCGRTHDSRPAWFGGGRGYGERMGYTDLRAAEREQATAARRAEAQGEPPTRTVRRNSASSRKPSRG